MNPPTTDEVTAAVDQLTQWGARVRFTVTLDRDTIGAGPGVAGLLRCLRAIVDAAPEYARRRATGPYRDGLREAQAEGREPDPIADLVDHLADQASRIPLGDTYRDGPLAGASRYNVALAAIREIVTWDHHRKGPKSTDCSACGKLRACIPHGLAGHHLCLECHTRVALKLAQSAPEVKVEAARRRATAAAVEADDDAQARDYARRLARGGVVR
ncbi:MAG TPA: hypothetical protein VFV33_21820 [Gemmatimonadaceae bacterium]|nr:hypothetical protein [Gemmatimonadaceae bacterium]